MKVKLKARCL
jgi:hypothetical protein